MAGPARYVDERITIETLVAGPLENNVYVVSCLRTGRAVIVDAADEADRIVDAAAGLQVAAILTTHGHADHVGAAAVVSDAVGAPVRIHPADAAMAGLSRFEPIEPEEVIDVGELQMRAIHTPGHTPGSTCFLLGDLLFSGDTLFPGGPGATTDPDRFAEIMTSLERRLFVLPDDTRVLPGHGLDTTIGAERPSLPEWRRRGY
jgi:glyoxylase-like metal-dependent hydrolase (beta-lactamase superfamily II)